MRAIDRSMRAIDRSIVVVVVVVRRASHARGAIERYPSNPTRVGVDDDSE
jgi:hypothetical protein